jgi:hypothetical protein
VVCGSCGSEIDAVWTWCPDCGATADGAGVTIDLSDTDLSDTDLSYMVSRLDAASAARLAEMERFPTEWAQPV